MNEKTVKRELRKYRGEDLLDSVTRLAYETAFELCGNNQTQTAAFLRVNRGTCRKFLRRYGII